MKASLVAPVGTTPPAVTEVLEHLVRTERERITDLVLLVSASELVRESAELVYSAVEVNHPKTRVHREDLDLPDTARVEQQGRFLALAASILRAQRVDHKVDRVYLNLAGGRKNMVLSLYLLGQLFAADAMFHVVCPDIDLFNDELERRRHEIKEHFMADDLTAYYLENREVFDSLLFPPPEKYEVMRIPFLPFPPHVLSPLGTVLKRDIPTPIAEVDVPQEYLRLLERCGLVVMGSKEVHPTGVGLAMGEAIWLEASERW